MKNAGYDPYREFNTFVNSLFISESTTQKMTEWFGPDGGYYATSYLRDLLTGTAIYWLFALGWHVTIYVILGKKLFKNEKRPFPTWAIILDQIVVAQTAIFMYAALPVFTQFVVENKLTRAYFYVDEIGGWGYYALYLFIYFCFVEYGVFWMHKTLHTNKFLYKYVHSLHHKYNSAQTLTPWSSIAFNPIDGILQASPYLFFMCIFPVHYLTHVFLVFFTAVWATNIHDALVGELFL